MISIRMRRLLESRSNESRSPTALEPVISVFNGGMKDAQQWMRSLITGPMRLRFVGYGYPVPFYLAIAVHDQWE